MELALCVLRTREAVELRARRRERSWRAGDCACACVRVRGVRMAAVWCRASDRGSCGEGLRAHEACTCALTSMGLKLRARTGAIVKLRASTTVPVCREKVVA
jgi:hypothetical protein